MTTNQEHSGIIVVKDSWKRTREVTTRGHEVHTYYLKEELPFDINWGDYVSLSEKGYVINYPIKVKTFYQGDFYQVDNDYCEFMAVLSALRENPPLGTFLGYYFIKKNARQRIDIRKRKFFKNWTANTKSPPGCIPMCKIVHIFDEFMPPAYV